MACGRAAAASRRVADRLPAEREDFFGFFENQRHRAKLLEDESLLEFVRESECVTTLYAALAEIQETYRNAHRCLDRSHTSGTARSFQLSLERLDDDGELLES